MLMLQESKLNWSHGELNEFKSMYCETLPARIEALESAKKALGEGVPDAVDRIRRAAHSLRGSSSMCGFPHITNVAAIAEEAPIEELFTRVAELLSSLYEVSVTLRADQKQDTDRRLPSPSTDYPEPYDSLRASCGKSQDGYRQPILSEKRILLIEDDPLVAAVVIHRLKREGFEVFHYDDGAVALSATFDARYSLAILDVKMPGMDGFELLHRLRSREESMHMPIIMLTSMGSAKDIARGFELGANDYILKPFSPAELLTRVQRFFKPPS